jgi:hypothetical protein
LNLVYGQFAPNKQKTKGLPVMKNAFTTKILLFSLAMAALTAVGARPLPAAVLTNSTTPFSLSFINPCNGHASIDAGLLHTVASTTFDGAGFHTKFHTNEVQARDTDQVTGEVCADTGAFNFQGSNFDVFTGTVGGLPLEATGTFTGLEACSGSMGTFLLHGIVHVTVNPNGIVTVDFDRGFPLTAECKHN